MQSFQTRDRKAVTILLTAVAFVLAFLSAIAIHDSTEVRTLLVYGAVTAAGAVSAVTGFLRIVSAPLSRILVWSPFFVLLLAASVALFVVPGGDLARISLLLLWACGAVLCWMTFSSEAAQVQVKPAQPGATDNPDDAQRLREGH